MTNGIAQGPRTEGHGAKGRDRRRGLNGVGFARPLDKVRFRDVAVAVVIALTIWGCGYIGPQGRIEPGRLDRHKTDFTVYTEAASAIFDGRDPYRVTSPRGWYYLYPPLLALSVAPLVIFDPESQVLAWYALSAALAFGCFAEARRLWRLLRDEGSHPTCPAPPRRVGTWAFLAVLLPTLDCLQRGQVGIMLLYFLMLGFRLVVQSRSGTGWLVGGLVLALPAALKLIPALPVGFLLGQLWIAAVRSGRRPEGAFRAGAVTTGVLLGAFLFLFAIPAAVVGWRKNLDYLHTWTVEVVANNQVGRRSNFDLHSPRNQSLDNAVHQWTDPGRSALGRLLPPEADRWARPAVLAMRGLVLTLLVALGLASGGRGRPLDLALGFSLACAATLLISPIAWGHYFMIELPALVVLPLWLVGSGHPRAARLLNAVPVLLAWAHYLLLRHVGPLGLLGLGSTAWFLAACALIALSWNASNTNGPARARPKRISHGRRRREREPRSVFSRSLLDPRGGFVTVQSPWTFRSKVFP